MIMRQRDNKKKRQKARYWCCRKTFQTGFKRQISNDFNLLSSLHNYTLADGFLLFDLDQSNICIEIFKR